MKKLLFELLAVLTVLTGATGCNERDHEPPDMETSRLLINFFDSISRGDHPTAARYGAKLLENDPNNPGVERLVAIQECNSFIADAQKALNQNDPASAVKALERGRRTFPRNRSLILLTAKVKQLSSAAKFIRTMERARSSSAMTSALSMAEIGLSDNITPELTAYFDRYRTRINAKIKKENSDLHKPEPIIQRVAPDGRK